MRPLLSFLRGSLLLELLLAIFLLALILPLLVSAVGRLYERHQLVQAYLDQQQFEAALEAHLGAQWSRLVPANCRDDGALFLTIQSGAAVPNRLTRRAIDSQSDWLKGSDYGLCRVALELVTNPFDSTLDCHWKAGDRVSFSSCHGRYSGQVLSTSSSTTRIELADDEALGQAGILASQDAFYWYLAKGKNGQNALWRTPQAGGNSLELWTGLERLAIFPLLDSDNDGYMDSLDSRYGDFRLQRLRGLWVEYLYEVSDCARSNKDKKAAHRDRQYTSMRGEVWHYRAPCQAVGNQIILLKAKPL